MIKKIVLIGVIIFCALMQIKAQKFYLKGYVNNMQSVMFDSLSSNWLNDNLIHNRLNMKYYANKNITLTLEVRNRIFTGETVKYSPNFSDNISEDNGYIDLSYNLLNKKSVLINSGS